jgi:oligopeptidase B
MASKSRKTFRLLGLSIACSTLSCSHTSTMTVARAPAETNQLTPPVAKQIPHPINRFGTELPDFYYWFRDVPPDGKSFSGDVLNYVVEENAYTTAYGQNWSPLRTQLASEIKAIQGGTVDLNVPTVAGGYVYVQITLPGDSYPSYVKELPDGTQQTVLLSGPKLAGTSDYFDLQIGALSPNGNFLPFAVDRLGNRSYALSIKNLQTGEIIPVRVDKTDFVSPYAPGIWSTDGQTLFYGIKNDLLSESGINKFNLQTRTESVVYTLDDLDFLPEIKDTTSGKYIVINLNYSIRTSELRLIDKSRPDGPAVVFTPKDTKLMYDADHIGDRFYIIGNKGGDNRDLYWAPDNKTAIQDWKRVTHHHLAKDIVGMQVMSGYVGVIGVEDDTRQVFKIVNTKDGSVRDIPTDSPTGSFAFATNRDPNSKTIFFSYRSLTDFPSLRQVDLETGKVTIVRESTQDPERINYVSERHWALSEDGTHVPMDIIYRKGTLRADGNTPLWLYAYGNYGENLNSKGFVDFLAPTYHSLLNRGVVMVFAYPRGGGERGRDWYLDGIQKRKWHSFEDFRAVQKYLVDHQFTRPERLVAEGISAAGLLMGNMANNDGALFKAIVMDAPFVDMINTLSDVTIHLTSQEWGEWGNPSIQDQYDYIRTYSPYDNVASGNVHLNSTGNGEYYYPDMLF